MDTENVVINGIPLHPLQLEEFKKTYNIIPKAGRYWYDSKSGMYGIEGQPAAGYLYPGHHYGELLQNASNGNTRVLINGRELTLIEYNMLCQLVGNIIFPGSYWLDAQGNAGIEGNPLPLVNLNAAAMQRSQAQAAGNSGDNFWTSRFSAGNSSGDSGYVSVDGYGPVGYGPIN